VISQKVHTALFALLCSLLNSYTVSLLHPHCYVCILFLFYNKLNVIEWDRSDHTHCFVRSALFTFVYPASLTHCVAFAFTLFLFYTFSSTLFLLHNNLNVIKCNQSDYTHCFFHTASFAPLYSYCFIRTVLCSHCFALTLSRAHTLWILSSQCFVLTLSHARAVSFTLS
jgi:hypothetical protein